MSWVIVWKDDEKYVLAHRKDKTFPGWGEAQTWALDNLAQNPAYPQEPCWVILPQCRAKAMIEGSAEDV